MKQNAKSTNVCRDGRRIEEQTSGPGVARLIRRDIRKREGPFVDEEDLAAARHEMMSPEARQQMGPMRIRRRRKIAANTLAGTHSAVALPRVMFYLEQRTYKGSL